VDFIIQRVNDIIPIEVKSEGNIESVSLRKYKEQYGDKVKLRIRFSMQNLKFDGGVLNIPLFLADRTDWLIGEALQHPSC
jgi:predicted AAA+ superfamily ATPase